jgi:hypothetical protein
MAEKPIPVIKDQCADPLFSDLLICEDYLDIHLLVFKISREMASADFLLKSAQIVQNKSAHLWKGCKNKGKGLFTLKTNFLSRGAIRNTILSLSCDVARRRAT